jgi:hypothetical protein
VLEPLGLPDHQHVLQVDLLGVRNRRQRLAIRSLAKRDLGTCRQATYHSNQDKKKTAHAQGNLL